MNGFAIGGSILPLFAYLLVSLRFGQKKGIWAAFVAYSLFVAWDYWDSGVLDRLLMLEGCLLVGMGAVALKLDDSRFFKFQPAVMGLIFALVMGWFQFFDIPLLVKMVPRMQQVMPAYSEVLGGPLMLRSLGRLSGQAALMFLIHGLLMAYAALKFRDRGWFLTRLAIYPMMFVLAFVNSLVMGLA